MHCTKENFTTDQAIEKPSKFAPPPFPLKSFRWLGGSSCVAVLLHAISYENGYPRTKEFAHTAVGKE